MIPYGYYTQAILPKTATLADVVGEVKIVACAYVLDLELVSVYTRVSVIFRLKKSGIRKKELNNTKFKNKTSLKKR
jgi:hypothetical protein